MGKKKASSATQQLKKLLNFMGMVFNIRDTFSFARNIFSAGGVASMVIATLKWLGKNVPLLSLILYGIGSFLIVLAVIPNVVRVFHKRVREIRDEGLETKTETKADDVKEEKRPRIFSAIHMLDNEFLYKCSKCDWGFVVGKGVTGVVCPKCGNADFVFPHW